MPLLFRQGGLVFMPGETALFKADDESQGEKCTVINFVPDGGVLKGYIIELDNADKQHLICDISQLIPLS